MTLSRHTLLLKLGIVLSAGVLGALILFSWRIIPFFPEFVLSAARRAVPVFVAAFLPPPAPYAAYVTACISVCYAFAALLVLFYFFEKTQSSEVRFFMLFVFSFVFEALRCALPLRAALAVPGVYLNVSAHILVFFRYAGVFALFCASLYSTGFKIKREENVIFFLIIAALFLSFRMPVNIYTWDTSLCLVSLYPFVFSMMEFAVGILTVLSFFAGAIQRGTKEYYPVGLGAALVLAGRFLLLHSDTLLLPVTGALLLAGGTFFICSYLRKIYLWL